MITVYYRPSDQDEEADEVLSRYPKVVGTGSHETSATLMFLEKQHCQAHAIKELLAVLKR